jgi:acyl-CoA synthetase (NDP forming)
MSHTGSAGDDLLPYDSLQAAGVITAEGLEELVDLLVGFTGPVMPRGSRVGLLAEAGGAAASGADAASLLGLEIPVLSAGAQEELSRILAEEMPPFPAPRNPVDMVWTPEVNPAEFYEGCARAMLPEVDALVVVNYVGFDDSFAGALAGARDDFGKPILFAPGHPSEHRDGMSVLTRHGLPAFTVPDRALAALAAMLRFSRRRAEA